jgi:hypothetical protein
MATPIKIQFKDPNYYLTRNNILLSQRLKLFITKFKEQRLISFPVATPSTTPYSH